jgi:hypothetical protein
LNVINCGSPIWLENNDWWALFKDREGGIRLSGSKKMTRSKNRSQDHKDEGVKKEGSTLRAKVKQGKKGAKKRCSVKECSNLAVNGGVCKKHGAKQKLCSSDGCTNIAVKTMQQ